MNEYQAAEAMRQMSLDGGRADIDDDDEDGSDDGGKVTLLQPIVLRTYIQTFIHTYIYEP
jgi:hypothetical protein